MKKVIVGIMMLVMLLTTSMAVTLKIIQPNGTVTMKELVGNEITLKDITNQIRWWKVISGGIEIIDNKFTMPNNSVEVEPQYTGNQIVVIQGENGTITPGTTVTTEGGSQTFTITPNSGYGVADVIVDGESKGARTSYTFSNINENHTITAIYEVSVINNYIVTFNANNGSGSMSNQTFTEGVPQNLTSNAFTRDGYTFAGWSTTQNGSVEYTDGQSYTATGNITLYAVWSTDSYTITYNLDGGTVSGNPTTYGVTSGDITLINPTKEGHTFTGWTGSNGNTPSTSVTIPTGSTGNKEYTANWSINTYEITVTQGTNGTITPGTTNVNHGSNQAFTITPSEGYVIDTLVVDGANQAVTNEEGMTYTFSNVVATHTITATFKLAWAGWNAPKLATGLTPVNWSGSAWTSTSEANWDYNYNSVATATQTTVAGNGNGKWANAQTADGSLYVWIPRYTYKIESGNHSNVDSWNSLDTPGTGKIVVKFSNGTTDDTSDSYLTHPAFTFGSDELTGIWVAKYEASRNDATSSSAGSGTTPTFKPGVVSWRSITVSDMFSYAYNLNRNLDSHLMKNTEWGAVAYLTNAIGRIPYINNSSSYITGNAGGSQNASKASGTTNAWNTANGVKASTTHNVYGLYDMSGGGYEYVAAYLDGASSSYVTNLVNASAKYKDVYSSAYSSSRRGDAVYETSSSSNSWDKDYSGVYNSDYPVFMRGGYYADLSSAGVFYFDGNDGNNDGTCSFRAVLSIP